MGSLFDGIGGFPLAAVRNGINPLWASEIEAFPIEVTKLRFPDMIHMGDITKLNGAELPPVRGFTLPGLVRSGGSRRSLRRTLRSVHGADPHCEGDEKC